MIRMPGSRHTPAAAATTTGACVEPARAVTVIVPVYRGLYDTQRCLNSVLKADDRLKWRLIVVDDHSPEPALRAWLERLAIEHPDRVLLLRNEANLGFVRSVNRALSLAGADDVVLLNNDTEVAPGWLDRLAQACHRADDIGTATPWSNHATIFSYPHYPEGGDLPAGVDVIAMDRLCAQYLAGQSVEVPTAHGFCMYVRADCLAATGRFDAQAFGQGYGEENDFCLRAARLGWRHVHALDVYVYHRGSVSFGSERARRVENALRVIRQRYPDYEAEVQRYLQADPTARHRRLLDLARFLQPGKARILFVSHDGIGGTERHQLELHRAFARQAEFMRLQPCAGGAAWHVMGGEPLPWHYRLPAEYDALVADLRQLGVQGVHYHHWQGLPVEILELGRSLGVPYDVTLHDHYTYCPQIHLAREDGHYCGERGEDQCRRCLLDHPAADGTRDIRAWRRRHARFLAGARHVLAPTRDVAARLQRYFALTALVAPHDALNRAEPLSWPPPQPAMIEPQRKLRVVVLGALGRIKGADLLEQTAALARQRCAPVEFHLLGYAYRALRTEPDTALICHGAYDDERLPELLRKLAPDVVWLPARVPETYSYTLSAALAAGLPVAATDLGALGERLHGRAWSWLLPVEADAEAWLALFVEIHTRLGCPGTDPAAVPSALSSVQTQGLTGRYPVFDYRRQYLPPIAAAPTTPAQALFRLWDAGARHRPLRTATSRAWRQAALRWLIRLRLMPVLRPLVRRLPMTIERRVKRWLLS